MGELHQSTRKSLHSKSRNIESGGGTTPQLRPTTEKADHLCFRVLPWELAVNQNHVCVWM